MPSLPDPSTAKFLNALNDFMENPPRDLPDGATDQLKSVAESLRGYASPDASPGERAALQANGVTDGTGNHYSKAATGIDKPSPGQLEFQKALEQMNQAAAAMAANGTPTDN